MRLWQEHQREIQLSALGKKGQEEAWVVISDRPAGPERLREHGWRMGVEAT